jgi:hypothetical protein
LTSALKVPDGAVRQRSQSSGIQAAGHLGWPQEGVVAGGVDCAVGRCPTDFSYRRLNAIVLRVSQVYGTVRGARETPIRG